MSRIRRRTDRAERLRRDPAPYPRDAGERARQGWRRRPGCAGRGGLAERRTGGPGGSFGAFLSQRGLRRSFVRGWRRPAGASRRRPRRRNQPQHLKPLPYRAWPRPERPPARSGLRHVRLAARSGRAAGLVRALRNCRGELTRPKIRLSVSAIMSFLKPIRARPGGRDACSRAALQNCHRSVVAA